MLVNVRVILTNTVVRTAYNEALRRFLFLFMLASSNLTNTNGSLLTLLKLICRWLSVVEFRSLPLSSASAALKAMVLPMAKRVAKETAIPKNIII